LFSHIPFVLQSHNAGEGAVRFRVCQLVNKVLNAMGEDVAIDDALYERLHHAMLQRLRDKMPAVRVQAVLAVTRLQDPRDNDCPVINGKQHNVWQRFCCKMVGGILESSAGTKCLQCWV
jgi:condensin complex subunit 3